MTFIDIITNQFVLFESQMCVSGKSNENKTIWWVNGICALLSPKKGHKSFTMEKFHVPKKFQKRIESTAFP